MNNEFQDIFNELAKNHKAELIRIINGKKYRRVFKPKERLILLGGGHVAQALANFAPSLEWDVTVVDDRADFANAKRFPNAAEIICSSFVYAINNELNISCEDYICVLTRGHSWDAECLRAVLRGKYLPYYLGMIGSRRRVAALMAMLKKEGFDNNILESIHSPIGLKIGAEGPNEIAISILAEMIQERHNRKNFDECLKNTDTNYEMLKFLADLKCPCALMMILETDGPVPAASGSLMMMAKNGRVFGTVGGGCTEWEVMNVAKNILGTGKSEVISVNLNSEVADNKNNVCGGVMKILIEDVNMII